MVAAGGMGQVWAAVDEVLDRRVAIKIMHPQTVEQLAMTERFKAEARFAAAISHPNIVEVFDFGEHDGLSFLVMELIDGPTLAQLVAEQGPLAPDHASRLLAQLAGALARAHENGIVHRDLKPSNVLISVDGLVKLMDFGIAQSVDGPSRTLTGEVLGTTYYISPEQALGRLVTPASDLYSLGALAYELLTGAKPFDRGTPLATALAQVEEPPPPLPGDVPARLANVVLACLSKEPTDRPTAAEVVQALTGEEAVPIMVPVTAVSSQSPPSPPFPLDDEGLAPTRRWLPDWQAVPLE